MNRKTFAIVIVLLHFAALTGYAMHQVGYMGIWQAGLANWGARQVLVDLVIACTLAMIWIVADARRHGLNPWPWLIVTVFAGSFGPLLYLLRREWRAPRTALRAARV